MRISILKIGLLTIAFSCGSYFCEGNKYAISDIPAELIFDGGAVIRNDEEIFEIEDISSATYQVTSAITIFNKEQQHFGILKLSYDNFRKIEELDGAIYNAKGKLVRELENSDIEDYAEFDGYSIYTDSRIKYVELYHNEFPYTIEISYEYKLNGYLNWPIWYSRNYLDAVEHSSFTVITPEKYNLRYWCNVDSVKPAKQIVNKKNIYFWQARILPKLVYDAVGEDIEDIATIVRIAPTDFEIDGYEGNMESWKAFGLWVFNLYKGGDQLPEAEQREIDDRIKSIQDEKQKVEILYRYMQSKTHYISVQLGIGGWRPFDATYVSNYGYGDCKALSNYMVSVLKYAGISAYPVLIRNGYYQTPLVTEFPSNQFNHVIVYIPLKTDTIWLECTSQIMPSGSLGSGNENREGLMITPAGGMIIKTPSSNAEKNLQIKSIFVTLSNSGNAKVNSKIEFTGDQHIYALHKVENYTSEQKNKWIRNLFEVPGIELKNYRFECNQKANTKSKLDIELMIKRYGAISGNRIFFKPNLIERRSHVPKSVDKRLSPVRFKYPYLDLDSIHYEIPNSYKVEALPDEINISSSFGSFNSKTYITPEKKILFVRSLRIDTYSIPADDYVEYQKFFAEVVKADKQQIVLVKE